MTGGTVLSNTSFGTDYQIGRGNGIKEQKPLEKNWKMMNTLLTLYD